MKNIKRNSRLPVNLYIKYVQKAPYLTEKMWEKYLESLEKKVEILFKQKT